MSERAIVCEDLNRAISELHDQGFRIDLIYPADEPHTALMSHGGEAIRLTTRPEASLPSTEPPPFQPEFVLTRAAGGSGAGRAGMYYRDLIPGRLGGRYIASHITIPEGGPVSDWVHYHRVAFQMIFVRSGWVRVVYEDQGEPFVMQPGDLVLQPPEIRHRVLESSAGLEVIEIGCPALHQTFADHEMALPTGRLDPNRDFGSQQFLRHVAAGTPWTAMNGFEAQLTALKDATGGLADARVLRPREGTVVQMPPHDGELVFGFVLQGSARLEFGSGFDLGASDTFVIPPSELWGLSGASKDFRLLHVTTRKSA